MTVEIFSFETMTWKYLGPVPTGRGMMFNWHTQQLADSFRIFGGNDSEDDHNEIYEFDPNTESWLVLKQKMARPRTAHALVTLPEGYLNC